MMTEINLKDMELTWDAGVQVLIHFVKKAQQKSSGLSSYKLTEAGVLYRATNFFNGSEKDLTEEQSIRLLINGVNVGQANGAYTLEEAAMLSIRFLPYLEEESKKRTSAKDVAMDSVKDV
jgi:hypothetical protein